MLIAACLGACIDPSPYIVSPLDATQMEGRFRNLSALSSVNILVFGDSGTKNQSQFETADQMAAACKIRGCDLAIGLGDNFYDYGVEDLSDEQWQESFEIPYQNVGAPIDFWMVLGNHDWAGNAQA